tara:strand:+ start:13 stop:678 length:666 start_codon:yes stop_codon:yes gene_type:complete
MSQHDFSIANQTASSARSDINNGLQALASNNSGSSAPSTTYANMFWYDTTNNILKVRDETDSSWIDVIYINQSTGVTSILNDTLLVTSGGSTTGLLGDQSGSIWNTGTGTTESLVSPAKLAGAISTYFTANSVGYGQTWQNLGGSRSANTAYQNTTSRPIQVAITASTQGQVQVSTNGSTYVTIQHSMGIFGQSRNTIAFIVPVNHYYKITSTFEQWAELR